MTKAKYEVIRPWFGVSLGDTVELEKVHPSLKSHVRAIKGEAKLEVATPNGGSKPKTEEEQQEELIAQLKELGVQADKRSSVEKLQEKLDEALKK